ncbi:hypothetical protein ES288_D04G230600v1 [Gossypium darwinii]|uniref:MATH domain-containing protein n=1 Tax=Gossypium darwinii TaxID=34276 RepID=A0A5D2D401_GOSDA|nr:hypothetical protein ES288_D04G230600v1 [Gossypium darwinii]
MDRFYRNRKHDSNLPFWKTKQKGNSHEKAKEMEKPVEDQSRDEKGADKVKDGTKDIDVCSEDGFEDTWEEMKVLHEDQEDKGEDTTSSRDTLGDKKGVATPLKDKAEDETKGTTTDSEEKRNEESKGMTTGLEKKRNEEPKDKTTGSEEKCNEEPKGTTTSSEGKRNEEQKGTTIGSEEKRNQELKGMTTSSEEKRNEELKGTTTGYKEKRKDEPKGTTTGSKEKRNDEPKGTATDSKKKLNEEPKGATTGSKEKRNDEPKGTTTGSKEKLNEEPKGTTTGSEEKCNEELKGTKEKRNEELKDTTTGSKEKPNEEPKGTTTSSEEKRNEELKGSTTSSKEKRNEEPKGAITDTKEKRNEEPKDMAIGLEEKRNEEPKGMATGSEEKLKEESKGTTSGSEEKRNDEPKDTTTSSEDKWNAKPKGTGTRLEEPKSRATLWDKFKDAMEGTKSDAGIKALRTWRELPPTHYIVKIKSFSSLVKSLEKREHKNYISDEFEASGFKWHLLLYPGVEKEKENPQVSLSLEFVSPKKLDKEIKAVVIFFLHDQVNNRYLSIQDNGMKRFSGKKKESELSPIVSLGCFEDPSNGYLVDDKCAFGVEVFVVEDEGKTRASFRTLMEESKKVCTLDVDVKRFISEKTRGVYSKPFTFGPNPEEVYKWRLHLSKGIDEKKDRYMSIYICLLQMENQTEFPLGWKMHLEFRLSLTHPNFKTVSRPGKAWFSVEEKAWGFPKFIKLDALRDYDGVEIEAEFIKMSMERIGQKPKPKEESSPSNKPK